MNITLQNKDNQWPGGSKFRNLLKIRSKHQMSDSWPSEAQTPEPRRCSAGPLTNTTTLQVSNLAKTLYALSAPPSFPEHREDCNLYSLSCDLVSPGLGSFEPSHKRHTEHSHPEAEVVRGAEDMRGRGRLLTLKTVTNVSSLSEWVSTTQENTSPPSFSPEEKERKGNFWACGRS